ncbi:hypothetical protein A2U01_0057914, partial [Trifolium medium]|nr:hypothetical protein [Trifolium medium]
EALEDEVQTQQLVFLYLQKQCSQTIVFVDPLASSSLLPLIFSSLPLSFLFCLRQFFFKRLEY